MRVAFISETNPYLRKTKLLFVALKLLIVFPNSLIIPSVFKLHKISNLNSMKTFILTLIFATFTLGGSAQEIYKLVYESAKSTLENPATPLAKAKIAQFKISQLTYLYQKAFETMPEVTDRFLDVQAYYLSEFMTLYQTDLVKSSTLSGEERAKRVMIFLDATVSNPLFNDTDEETIYAYIHEGTELTPFSLDTDWEKALAAVKAQLK